MTERPGCPLLCPVFNFFDCLYKQLLWTCRLPLLPWRPRVLPLRPWRLDVLRLHVEEGPRRRQSPRSAFPMVSCQLLCPLSDALELASVSKIIFFFFFRICFPIFFAAPPSRTVFVVIAELLRFISCLSCLGALCRFWVCTLRPRCLLLWLRHCPLCIAIFSGLSSVPRLVLSSVAMVSNSWCSFFEFVFSLLFSSLFPRKLLRGPCS